MWWFGHLALLFWVLLLVWESLSFLGWLFLVFGLIFV
jgi:hypothetical protein